MLLYQWLIEASERCGSAKAIIYRDTYLSFRGLSERVDRRAMELVSSGVRAGNLVGVMLGNVPEFIIFCLAISKLDATIVPIDPSMGVRELQQLLELIPLRALVTRPRGGTDPVSSVQQGSPGKLGLYPRIVTSSAYTSSPGLIEPEVRRRLQGTLITCAMYKREVPPVPDCPVIFVSSDEFGRPKGICRSEENLTKQVEMLARALSVVEGEQILATIPLYTSYGFDIAFLLALRFGYTMCLEEEIAPGKIAKLLREQSITLFPGLPRIYAAMTKLVMPATGALRARLVSSETALPPSLASLFLKKYGSPIWSLYRTVQMGCISLDIGGHYPGTVGTLLDGVDLSLESVASRTSSPALSRIRVRSAACSTRTIVSPLSPKESAVSEELVLSTSKNAWFDTGDLGYLNDEGRLVLIGRVDDMVKVAEKRVMLHEVTNCLLRHPFVVRAETKLKVDTEQNHSLVVKAKCNEQCREEVLLTHCAKWLAPHKVPRRIEMKTIELDTTQAEGRERP